MLLNMHIKNIALIDEIDIAGVPNYTKKLGETIQKSQLLNYNCDTLKINYI